VIESSESSTEGRAPVEHIVLKTAASLPAPGQSAATSAGSKSKRSPEKADTMKKLDFSNDLFKV